MGLRHGELEHIRCLNICGLLEHRHELRQIVELCKSRFGAVSRTLRGKLNGRHRLAEGGGPGIEVEKVIPAQRSVLEIFLHGVHLHHAVGDGCAGSKHNASAAGQLVQIPALHIQVAGLHRLGLADAAHIPHFCKCGEVFIVMRLIDEDTVNAQLFKGHHIILAGLIVKLVQLLLDRFLGSLQLFDGEIIPTVFLQFGNAVQHLIQLLLQDGPLALQGHGDLFKLAVTNDDRIVVAGGNAPAELLSILGLEVLLGGDKNVGRGVELEVFARPLLRQMIGDHKQAFLAQAQPFALLRSRYHLERLPGPHYMGKQGVTAVEDMGNGIDLMRPQCDLRIDSHEIQVAAVILAGANAVELLVIQLSQLLPAFRIAPYPIGKGLLDKLLLALGDSRLFLVEHSRFLAVSVLDVVEDSYITEVQGFLHDLIAVDSTGTVGIVSFHIAAVVGFSLHIPFTGVLRVVNMDIPLAVARGAEQLKHELLDGFRGQPCCAKPHGNFTCRQVNGLDSLQRSHILGIILRIELCAAPRPFELLADIAGEIFIGREILRLAVLFAYVHGVEENNTLQILEQLLLGFAGELRHIRHIDSCFFCKGQRIGLGSRVNRLHRYLLLDGSFGEHICLAEEVALIIQHLQRGKQAVGAVGIESRIVGSCADKPIFFAEIIIEAIEFFLLCLDIGIGIVLRLVLNQRPDTITDGNHAFDAAFGSRGNIHGIHAAVFTVIDFTVHHREAEIAHIRVSGNRKVLILRFKIVDFKFGNLGMNVLDGIL